MCWFHADEDTACSDHEAEDEMQHAAQQVNEPLTSVAGAELLHSVTRQQSSHIARTTTDSVLDGLLTQVEQPPSALKSEQLQAAPSLHSERQAPADAALLQHESFDRPSSAAKERTTVDSVLLGAVLNQAVAQDLDTASQAGSLPSAATASVDSLLDGILQEAAAVVNGGRTTTDSVLDSMLAEAAAHDQQLSQHASRRTTDALETKPAAAADIHSTAAERPTCNHDHTAAQTHQQVVSDNQHDATVARQLAAIGDDQPRTTADQVLDTVLEQVAADASRQRTTADSVLDAVLADIGEDGLHSSSRLQSGAIAGATDYIGQDDAQEDGYASQVSAFCTMLSWPSVVGLLCCQCLCSSPVL